MNKQQIQSSLKKGIIKSPCKRKEEKECTYFLPTLIDCFEQATDPREPKKGIIKSPHKRKGMDGKYSPLLTNQPSPAKRETKKT